MVYGFKANCRAQRKFFGLFVWGQLKIREGWQFSVTGLIVPPPHRTRHWIPWHVGSSVIWASLVKSVPTQSVGCREDKKKFLGAIPDQLLTLPPLIVWQISANFTQIPRSVAILAHLTFSKISRALEQFFKISKSLVASRHFLGVLEERFALRHF